MKLEIGQKVYTFSEICIDDILEYRTGEDITERMLKRKMEHWHIKKPGVMLEILIKN